MICKPLSSLPRSYEYKIDQDTYREIQFTTVEGNLALVLLSSLKTNGCHKFFSLFSSSFFLGGVSTQIFTKKKSGKK